MNRKKSEKEERKMNSINPTKEDVINIAVKHGLNKKEAEAIFEEIKTIVVNM